MNGINGTWSLDFIIGMIVAPLLFAICFAAAVLAFRWVRRNPNDFDRGMGVVGGVAGIMGAVLVVAVTGCATFPWESQYHRYEPKVGEVLAIEKWILPSGDSMEEKFAVQFSGLSGQYGCEDTRCALVRPGDMLALRCIQVWDYSATDGYDCRFVAHERKAS